MATPARSEGIHQATVSASWRQPGLDLLAGAHFGAELRESHGFDCLTALCHGASVVNEGSSRAKEGKP
jgi:hypothetical protein